MYQQARMLLSKLPVTQAVTIATRYWSQILVFIVTATSCWYLWSPAQPKPETYKPEVKQTDGSIVVERKPDPEAHAAMLLPKGAKLQRKIMVTLQAKPVSPTSVSETSPATKAVESHILDTNSIVVAETPVCDTQIECPPVTLDLALVRMPDDSQRIIARSEDGIIISAIDVPVESAMPPTEPKNWSVGIVGDPFRQTIGAFVDRRFGWGMIGTEIMQREYMGLPGQFNVKTGINF